MIELLKEYECCNLEILALRAIKVIGAEQRHRDHLSHPTAAEPRQRTTVSLHCSLRRVHYSYRRTARRLYM